MIISDQLKTWCLSNMSENKPLDFNRLSWFVAGLIVGSILDTTTTLVLIISWIIITNEPLPEMLGGYYPQNILRGIIQYINSKITRNKKSSSSDGDSARSSPPVPITTVPLNSAPIIFPMQLIPGSFNNTAPRVIEQ